LVEKMASPKALWMVSERVDTLVAVKENERD